MFNAYYASRFPECLYVVDSKHADDYASRVIYGFNKMAESSITIGILARNLESILPYTIARINSLRAFFKSSTFVAYENDSTDNTKNILSPATDLFISEQLQWPVNVQDKSLARKERMAYYRNRCRDLMLQNVSDFYAVYDADIEGGFSYEGVANSFSYEWSVVGSNGLIYDTHEGQIRRLYYDTWAWRNLGDLSDHQLEEKNLMFCHRGDPLIPLTSCFGGLAIYTKEAFTNPKYKYTAEDCDHVTLHIPMWKDGHAIFMNPSQIVLYNTTRFVT